MEGVGRSVADSGVRKTAEEAKYKKVLRCRWMSMDKQDHNQIKKHITIQEKLVSHNHTL